MRPYNQYMGKILRGRFPIVLVLVFLLIVGLVGCEKKPPVKHSPNPGLSQHHQATSSLLTPAPLTGSATTSGENPLAQAQREYLSAYEVYVKSLRESGPQTMDTLQALADYQKKYQLYQMLLEAEKR